MELMTWVLSKIEENGSLVNMFPMHLYPKIHTDAASLKTTRSFNVNALMYLAVYTNL